MNRCSVTLVLGVVGLLTSAAWATNVAITSGRDNTLYQDASGAISNGSGEYFFAGSTAAGAARRGLLWFDIAAAIPAGATINSVTLTLHMSMSSGGASNVGLHQVLSNWGEGASNAAGGEGGGTAAAAGDATWLHTFFNSSTWANPGGDFASAATAVTSVNAVGSYTWSSASMAAEVQSWLSTPGANFGWLLKGDEAAMGTTKRFDSRESLTAEFRPVLAIDYTPVPGPGVAAVLALGFARGRRRRG